MKKLWPCTLVWGSLLCADATAANADSPIVPDSQITPDNILTSARKGGAEMLHRVLLFCIIVGLLTAWGGCTGADTHQGKVVETGAGKLTMTDMAGQNQHAHEVASDATITCGATACG